MLTVAPLYVSLLSCVCLLVLQEVAILRPGCGGVPAFNFVSEFWVTLLFMAFAALAFFTACCVRFCILAVRARKQVEGVDDAAAAEPSLAVSADTDTTSLARLKAATLRRTSVLQRMKAMRAERSPHWIDFTERMQHAVLILFCIFVSTYRTAAVCLCFC